MVNGYDASDQVVRYSMEGMEILLRITGTAAKHAAAFLYAALRDQKKTRGKTTITRMLRENKPLKFFQLPVEQLKEFATQTRKYGLLYVAIMNKGNASHADIMVMAQDAPKINRIMDNIKLAVVDAGTVETQILRDQGDKDILANFTERGQGSPSMSSLPSSGGFRPATRPLLERGAEIRLLPAPENPILVTEPPRERLALPAPMEERPYVLVKEELAKIKAAQEKAARGRAPHLKTPVRGKQKARAHKPRVRGR